MSVSFQYFFLVHWTTASIELWRKPIFLVNRFGVAPCTKIAWKHDFDWLHLTELSVLILWVCGTVERGKWNAFICSFTLYAYVPSSSMGTFKLWKYDILRWQISVFTLHKTWWSYLWSCIPCCYFHYSRPMICYDAGFSRGESSSQLN